MRALVIDTRGSEPVACLRSLDGLDDVRAAAGGHIDLTTVGTLMTVHYTADLSARGLSHDETATHLGRMFTDYTTADRRRILHAIPGTVVVTGPRDVHDRLTSCPQWLLAEYDLADTSRPDLPTPKYAGCSLVAVPLRWTQTQCRASE